MASASKLDSLPTELMMAILGQVPDVKTLSALVHASPRLHAVYSAVRESVLTKAILRELGTKDLPLDIEAFLKPAGVYCLFTTKETLDPNLRPAVKSCQVQSSKAVDIILSVNQCIALRTIVSYYGWSIVEDDDHSRSKSHTMMYSNSAVSFYKWRHRLGVGDSYGFHVLIE
jgi:hypothetical protein